MFVHEEEQLGKIYDSRIMGRLLSFLEKDWWMIAVSLVLGLIVAAAEIVFPAIIQRAIDRDIFPVYRLVTLNEEEVELHDEYVLNVRDSNYVILQADLSELPRNRARNAEPVEYYLFEKSKVEEEFDSQELTRYPVVGTDKLLIPYDDLQKMEGEERVFSRSVLLVLRDANWQGLLRLAILFLIISIIRFIASYAQILLTATAGQNSMHRLRMSTFSHIQRLPVQYFDRNPVGRLVTRNTNDVQALNQFFTEVVTSLFYDGFLLIGLMVFLPLYNWRLALVTFGVVPPLLLATVIFRRLLRDAFRKVRVRLAKINAFLAEHFSGIKVVQMFRQERKRLNAFNVINESHFKARFGQMILFAIFRPLVDLLLISTIAAVLWFGANWVVGGVLTIGFLAAFLRYVEKFFQPIRDLSEKFQVMQQAMASGERIFMLADEAEEVYDGAKLPAKTDGGIEFRDVSFAYNDEDWILKDINFRIKPGERVAFVGATGAGKTSIINTLCRFYEIQRGKILVDGKDARNLDKKDLRSRIGIVMQDVFLFLGDIETNIKLRSDISHDRVEAAAIVTNADKFISKLPDGYKAPVQERGVNLSVGERQLVAFARALAINPSILILDEATSSVDTKTEALIQDAIHKLLEGRTALIIAHRLSTVRDADRIIVLDHGRMVEEGTHDALMKRKGVYYGLYKLQFEHKI
ncbi:ATP-binding cassette domain-containing protein [candidate division WOR-3 bacterium]|uniref:ATP-binding cassette domain-containing protein n=1 Tax=candidate division WOR-3 bacterium TaxID=2052148 RepID=A0A9D5K9A7_UNCW3|nr:ATP-binding cassette domain-containing protein [candidate division WOR-3 bacterium]MBD3363934.1 ATP-binding cassette domain-containing protein [candidate division WOR-3 bacterium]